MAAIMKYYDTVLLVLFVLRTALSHAVLRGEPTAAQRYLDSRLLEAGRDVTLPHLIYHCMRQAPADTHMINGTSNEVFTNEQILRRAVSLSRALQSRGAAGGAVLCVMSNHQQLVALYYAALWGAATPCLLEPLSAAGELSHFLALVSPRLVVCDADRREHVAAAVRDYALLTDTDIISHDQLDQFAAGHDSDPENFTPTRVAASDCAVFLPTSGSTGLAKLAEMSHGALLAQLPNIWTSHTEFPRPTARAMFMSTAQWVTFTNMLTTCPVYRITLVLTPDKTLPTVLRVIETYQPTWLLLVPGTAAAAADAGRPLTSLRTIVVTGAAPAPAVLRRLQELAPDAAVCNGYGMMETQGFVAIADRAAPFATVGKVFNIFHYKLVSEDGEEVKRGERGELYLKSDCVIERYLNNEEAYLESATADGWWRTGDVFYEDEQSYLFFVERKKFWFKYLNYHISPEELEKVISAVAGVQEVAVAGTERGAAAAVVCAAGRDVTRQDIHRAVDSELMEYKRLRGGVAFVTSLPRTHSGKLHRADCTRLLNSLVESGDCY